MTSSSGASVAAARRLERADVLANPLAGHLMTNTAVTGATFDMGDPSARTTASFPVRVAVVRTAVPPCLTSCA